MSTDESRYRIEVEVDTNFLEDESAPAEDRYVFSYTITLTNTGSVAARLLTRHWVITNAEGKSHEVEGDGVVGKQPHLQPGEHFRYTSGALINTAVGTMRGTYRMLADDGLPFDAEIAPFTLAAPRTLH